MNNLHLPTADLATAVQKHQTGDLSAAADGFRAVLALAPSHPVALHGLGLVQHQLGRHAEAVPLLQAAVAAAPHSAPFRSNLAAVLGRLGRHREAAVELRQAVLLKPDYAEAWCNLGVALERTGQLADACTAFRRATQVQAGYLKAINHLGSALRRMGRFDDSEAAYRDAIRIDPKSAGAWAGLAHTLSGQGRLEEVIDARRKVAELKPSPMAGSALLATLHYDAAITPAELWAEAESWARRWVTPVEAEGTPFSATPLLESLGEQSGRVGQAGLVRSEVAGGTPAPQLARRIRVGFLSANFAAHPEGRFIRPVLANLPRDEVETFSYSNTARIDSVSQVIRPLCDHWREIRKRSSTDAAEMIRKDQLDILIDLTGHFGNNRLDVLAQRPAPVQAALFGYPGTYGMAEVQWRFTDRYANPPNPHLQDPADGVGPYAVPEARGETRYTTERLIGLGESAWCYEPPMEARSIGGLPLLKNGFVTFACVNNTLKLTGEAIEAWAQILRRTPGSRLMILSDRQKREKPSGVAERTGTEESASAAGAFLQKQLTRLGIESGRFALVPRQSRARYFEMIHAADIALDPFPYNGGVTSCDTMWMGTPIITRAGQTYWSRQGAMLLNLVGLPKLVASSWEGYIDAAVGLAADQKRLGVIRASLRERLAASPICNLAGFATRLLKAVREMTS